MINQDESFRVYWPQQLICFIIKEKQNLHSMFSLSNTSKPNFDWTSLRCIDPCSRSSKLKVHSGHRASTLRLQGCGFDARLGHTNNFLNGAYCLPAWYSVLVVSSERLDHPVIPSCCPLLTLRGGSRFFIGIENFRYARIKLLCMGTKSNIVIIVTEKSWRKDEKE